MTTLANFAFEALLWTTVLLLAGFVAFMAYEESRWFALLLVPIGLLTLLLYSTMRTLPPLFS